MSRNTLTAAGLLATALPALAQTPDAVVPPVLVSTTRTESTITTPASVAVIDRAAIEASGAENLTQLLAGQGGIQIKELYGDGSRATIGMRGLTGGNAAANTLVLVDGRRLNNADLAGPDLASVRLKDVERIEVLQGSAGTLFGDQAVGGVINIITRTPRATGGSIEATAGSYDRRRLAGEVTAVSENGLGLRLSGESHHSDNDRDHNRRDYENLFGRLDYRTRGGTVLFAELQHADEELQLPGAISAEQMAADPQQIDPMFAQDYDSLRTETARVGLRQPLGGQWQFEGEVTLRDAQGDGNLYGGHFTQSRSHLGATPRLIGSFATGQGDALLTLGSDLDQIDYEFHSDFVGNDSTQRTRAFYAQAVVPLTRTLGVTAGARHAAVDYDLADAGTFPEGQRLDDEVTVWELGASLALTPEWRLFARRDGNFRFAKVDELTFLSPGETGLDTQTGVSYELGSEWIAAGHRAKTMVYRLDLDNEIDFDSTAPGPWGFGANVNLPQTRRSGAILEGRLAVNPRLALDAQYTYTEPEMTGGPFSGKTIPFVARHSARAAADLLIAEHWNGYAEVVYTGERYQDSDYDNALPKLDPTTLLNLAVRWNGAPWRVTARVDNLTDEEYAGYATFDRYYPAPGRNGSLTVSYTF